MPLITSVIRNGEAVPIRWGSFHVGCMVIAAAIDSGRGPWEDNSHEGIITETLTDDPELKALIQAGVIPLAPKDYCGLLVSYPVIGMTPLNDGEYMLSKDYAFMDLADGEMFYLFKGDILNAYRGY